MHPESPMPATQPASQAVKIIVLIAIVLVALIGGFAAGVQYQKGHAGTATASTMNGRFSGQGGFGGRAMEGSFGTVSTVSATSITIQDERTGTTKAYGITSNTIVTNNGSVANVSDIASGDSVIIRTSSATSTDATSIRINPSMGGGTATPTTTN